MYEELKAGQLLRSNSHQYIIDINLDKLTKFEKLVILGLSKPKGGTKTKIIQYDIPWYNDYLTVPHKDMYDAKFLYRTLKRCGADISAKTVAHLNCNVVKLDPGDIVLVTDVITTINSPECSVHSARAFLGYLVLLYNSKKYYKQLFVTKPVDRPDVKQYKHPYGQLLTTTYNDFKLMSDVV